MWIEPLDLETWFINVFSGSNDIFAAIAVMVIMSLGSFFRMTTLTMFLMLGIFMLMFSGFIGSPILFIFAVIGGLAIGFSLSKMFS